MTTDELARMGSGTGVAGSDQTNVYKAYGGMSLGPDLP